MPDASELHRALLLSVQDLRKPQMQSDARPLQEQRKSQAATLEQELTVLRERVEAQSELLEERAGQISDLKEDRDRWRQQATSLLVDQRSSSELGQKIKSKKWWLF
ncbi:hypothetical protein [Paracoccus haeundaensis]|uniref:Uncharacterized protein n=1 Tax=Paracoccus haeundaensis TaxID=225362 RepID=A0A5C4R0S3_9RHOB|nr:hypothetical protein [Paracoccus haeundaensis]TNH37575.1 hypothetical protein FHD67_19565 [Paracoccus haeundaensis]